jgi:hypothetical protein
VSIIVPPFVQYQAPLFPLRGLWNNPPTEGDRFVSAEILWGVTTGNASAVQFDLSGNSPVAFSQIVAFSVDNSLCASDVQFLFPDSGYTLNVPAYNQGCYPVFTNALMFYATATLGAVGDRTVFQVLNSMPPPIAVQPTEEMSQAVVPGLPLSNNIFAVLPPGVSGTIQAYDMGAAAQAAGTAQVVLYDGSTPARNLFSRVMDFTTAQLTIESALSGLRLRFFNGLNIAVQSSTVTGGVSFNIYYSLP